MSEREEGNRSGKVPARQRPSFPHLLLLAVEGAHGGVARFLAERPGRPAILGRLGVRQLEVLVQVEALDQQEKLGPEVIVHRADTAEEVRQTHDELLHMGVKEGEGNGGVTLAREKRNIWVVVRDFLRARLASVRLICGRDGPYLDEVVEGQGLHDVRNGGHQRVRTRRRRCERTQGG